MKQTRQEGTNRKESDRGEQDRKKTRVTKTIKLPAGISSLRGGLSEALIGNKSVAAGGGAGGSKQLKSRNQRSVKTKDQRKTRKGTKTNGAAGSGDSIRSFFPLVEPPAAAEAAIDWEAVAKELVETMTEETELPDATGRGEEDEEEVGEEVSEAVARATLTEGEILGEGTVEGATELAGAGATAAEGREGATLGATEEGIEGGTLREAVETVEGTLVEEGGALEGVGRSGVTPWAVETLSKETGMMSRMNNSALISGARTELVFSSGF